jgi:hypothetical protein
MGKGGFAKCYSIKEVIDGWEIVYAAKIINKQELKGESAKVKLQNEIKLHKSCNH